MEIRELIDRQQITDLITAYTRGIDGSDHDRAAGIFTDDAVVDYTSAGGPRAQVAEGLAWVGGNLAHFDRWQHLIGQVDVVLEGDEARATAYLFNALVLRRPDGTEKVLDVGGYYHHTLVRAGAGWRSREMIADIQWMRGF